MTLIARGEECERTGIVTFTVVGRSIWPRRGDIEEGLGKKLYPASKNVEILDVKPCRRVT